MRQYGLIGYPLEHSFSKGYFSDKFQREQITDCHYENFQLESVDSLPFLLDEHPEIVGLNVTIPYKQEVMAFLDELDEEAETIGAVNTVKVANGKLKGYNTDVYGFMKSLEPLLPALSLKALILGTGGASKAVAFGLKKLNIPFQFVSRKSSENAVTYNQLSVKQTSMHKLIINTTPLGMFPHLDTCPDIPYNAIGGEHILYDLVYNPETTLFLQKGTERGAAIKNGLEMLHLQAEKAWEIWNEF